MQRLFVSIGTKVFIGWMLLMMFTSCIHDGAKDCGVIFTFDYSYNVLEVNAFHKQVDELLLYLFNEEGLLQEERKMEGPFAADFSLDWGLLAPGKYELVAWAKQKGKEGFALTPLAMPGKSKRSDFKLSLIRDEANSTQSFLGNHLIGEVAFEVEQTEERIYRKVDLKKVTNTLRLVLLSTDDTELQSENFDFQLVDAWGAGWIAPDYSLLPNDRKTIYLPYFQSLVKPRDTEHQPNDRVSPAVVAEFSTSRLMKAHQPRLIITEKVTGEVVIDTDLMWFIELMEMNGYLKWPFQEYLDRQDEFVITLYLKEGLRWVDLVLIINGWVINNIGIEA